MLIITTRGKQICCEIDVCFFLIQCQWRTCAWMVALIQFSTTNSLKCSGFVWESLFASTANKPKYTNIQKLILHLQIYLQMECKRFTKCMEKFLQFSVRVVAWKQDKMVNFLWFFPLWNAPEIIELTRDQHGGAGWMLSTETILFSNFNNFLVLKPGS